MWLVWGLWLRVSLQAAVKLWARVTVFEDLTGAEGSTSKLTHMAVGRRF